MSVEAAPRPRRHRPLRIFLVIGVVVVVAILALILVPARTQSQVLSVSSGTSPSTSFTFSGPTYVTVHFSSYSSYGMRYWMSGPSGMMHNHSMMGGGMMSGVADSYSFWTWGGEYRCGASFVGGGAGSMPVWINATSALL